MTQKSDNSDYVITISGRHVEVTPAMKEYAKEKLSKVDSLGPKAIELDVVMDIQKLDHKVDVVYKFSHFKVKVQGVAQDMYAAIDMASAKLQGLLRRYKSKIQDHHAKGVKAVEMQVQVLEKPRSVDYINDQIEEVTQQEIEEAFRPKDVVKEETRPLKMLTTEEAMVKMELSGDMFLLYRSEEDQALKVIYRRQDGNYGIIHPE